MIDFINTWKEYKVFYLFPTIIFNGVSSSRDRKRVMISFLAWSLGYKFKKFKKNYKSILNRKKMMEDYDLYEKTHERLKELEADLEKAWKNLEENRGENDK